MSELTGKDTTLVMTSHKRPVAAPLICNNFYSEYVVASYLCAKWQSNRADGFGEMEKVKK